MDEQVGGGLAVDAALLLFRDGIIGGYKCWGEKWKWMAKLGGEQFGSGEKKEKAKQEGLIYYVSCSVS